MRQVMRLDGLWRFVPDLDPEYHGPDYYASPEWDRRHWETVPVPGCWNTYRERYALFEGVAWFSREFHVEALPSPAQAFLRFEGVNYEARVFLNGQLLGEHEGGYTAFTMDASQALHVGRNVLGVRVSNRRDRLRLPACLGWFNWGGIHRSVALEVSRRVRLERVWVEARPVPGGAVARIRIRTRARPDDDLAGIDYWVSVPALGRQSRHRASGAAETVLELDLPGAQAWSPETPHVYRLRVDALSGDGEVLDSVEVPLGVRTIEAQGRTILLNGRPTFFRGLCYLYDHPAVGMTYHPEIVAADLDDLQALHVNCLRTHFPLPEAFLEACDARGLMVWMEVPIYCLAPRSDESTSAFAQPAYQQLAIRMLREMIEQAYNHPSVVLWSVGNECNTAHPESRQFFEACVHTVRELDASRLVGYAALYAGGGSAAALVDVAGMNQYWDWYDRCATGCGPERPLATQIVDGPEGRRLQVEPLVLTTLREQLAGFVAAHPKPIFLTEFGADAVAGYRSLEYALWSEDYQALLLEKTFEVLADFPEVSGAFPFAYQDYADPSKPVNHRWQGDNLKGLVTRQRQRKLAFEKLAAIYSRPPWASEAPPAGQPDQR